MIIRRITMLFLLVLVIAGCAASRPLPRTEFEDIPLPKGLTYQPELSTVIESPTVKAVRLVYRGRLEPESLGQAMRSTLEANGWRHVSSTRSGKKGAIQVYEKPGTAMQVHVYEGWWYTYVEIDTTRTVSALQ
jgi:hypothetical protein